MDARQSIDEVISNLVTSGTLHQAAKEAVLEVLGHNPSRKTVLETLPKKVVGTQSMYGIVTQHAEHISFRYFCKLISRGDVPRIGVEGRKVVFNPKDVLKWAWSRSEADKKPVIV